MLLKLSSLVLPDFVLAWRKRHCPRKIKSAGIDMARVGKANPSARGRFFGTCSARALPAARTRALLARRLRASRCQA